MDVRLAGWGAFVAEGPGALADFEPRKLLPDRKHARWMSRSVQLGVAAVRAALDRVPGWDAVPPERRGLFVGTSPGGGDPDDLVPALEAATVDGRLDLAAFGERGIPLIPPLWLVRGLTNNVVGFSSAYHDLRGPNATRCDGRTAGLAAIVDGARAIAEGRADLVIAGGHDSLVHAAAWLPTGSEAAVFVVLDRGDGGPRIVEGRTWFGEGSAHEPAVEHGAATGLGELVRRLERGADGGIEVVDAGGGRAAIRIGTWDTEGTG